ncbi:hypothetical protein [Aliikangiella coralliicola]|uniref:Immunity protein 35 domain-containing protein n=1 Tax=Aliikangiella coralliicola TaxID=2592383 RepID=A0A545U4H7_9GAMM|nr:hypothetical protein [Aliikangiella coralliicola]TQV84356.1 hypothetical protein FLL46_22285 [Aliikangiella coralliicola]
MAITLEEAKSIVEDYKKSHFVTEFDSNVVEQEKFWYFRVGFVGSSGVIVNKFDGRLFVMGSGLSNEEMFWGHENGFSPDKVDIEIFEVNNPLKVSGMVGALLVQLGKAPSHPNRAAREIARELIKELPQKFHGVSLWLQIPWFIEAVEQNWLTYKINEHRANT